MKMRESLRSAIFGVFAILWTLICFFLVTIALPFSSRGRLSHWVVRHIWAAGILWFCRVKVIATGVDGFERNRPYVFVANHQSHLDILTIFYSNPVNLRFIAKQSLFAIPFFGWYLALAGYVPLDRSNRERAIRSHERAAEKIQRGVPIVSFPEGTRSVDGQVQTFKKGAFMLALQAGVPVVPISITGSMKVLRKKSISIRPGTIWIHYAAPFDTTGYSFLDRDRLITAVREIIIHHKAELDDQTNQGRS